MLLRAEDTVLSGGGFDLAMAVPCGCLKNSAFHYGIELIEMLL